MSAIRPCRGGPSVPFTDAPPGFRPSLRPSSLPPPPTRLPHTKISNREPLRLEIHATQRKQTSDHHSNRENIALFSDRIRAVNRLCHCGAVNSARRHIVRPTRRPKPIISNREPLRLEIHATKRKQTTDHLSNRENNACFSDRDQPTLRPSLRISNRESLRLEIRLTQTKQRPEHDPNRENKVCLSNPDHSNKIRLKRSISPTQETHNNPEKLQSAPPIFVAIKNKPHRLFSMIYQGFLISPCSDNSEYPANRPPAELALPARSLSRGTIFAVRGPRYPVHLMPQRSDFKRRSKRLGLRVPVRIYGRTADDRPFRDMTETLHVNAFGARIELGKLLTPGQTILLVHGITEEEKECRVVDVRPNRTGKWKVGLAFVKPEGNFWHIFQPLARVGNRGNDHVE
jgi:hypothetical protein